MSRAMVTVTCVGCGKTGKTPAPAPLGVPLCPDCEPRAAAILSDFDSPVRSGESIVTEDEP